MLLPVLVRLIFLGTGDHRSVVVHSAHLLLRSPQAIQEMGEHIQMDVTEGTSYRHRLRET